MNVTGGGRHGHLWLLADGTPAHAPPGVLTRNDEGDLACHLCGRWFAHLGAHLRRHGWTADRYREAVGLAQNRALCNERIGGRIAERQAARWREDENLRASLDEGRATARRAQEQGSSGPRRVAPETAAASADRLREMREANAARCDHALATLASLAEARTVGDLLRGCYEAGDDLDALQLLTGWSRERVRRELAAAGACIRPTGMNTAATKARRARLIDAEVGVRVGTDDVTTWLRDRRGEGLTLPRLAVQTGRSTAWVRARLRGCTTTAAARRTS